MSINAIRTSLFFAASLYCAAFFIPLVKNQSQPIHKNAMTDSTVQNHTYGNFRDVTIKHLHLDLFVDFSAKSLNGFAVLDIQNVKEVPFIVLDYKNLVIEKVEVDGKHVSDYQTGGKDSILGNFIKIPIDRTSGKVKIYYHTLPEAEALQWLSKEQTHGKDQPFLFTQSQAILARTWIPIMDAPAVRFTYSARIRVPKGLMALMSAENPQTIDPNGVYEFKMNQPIPSYLMALSVGHLAYQSLDDRCGVYAEPGMLDASVKEFVDLPQMVKSAEKLYGPYRWGRYDLLVLPPSFPFGGMENPRLTFATPTIIAGDKSLVSLVAHELAHSWSGNLVTNATWNDFWLNEGFTVYFEQRIMEEVYGKPYAEMLAEIALGELRATVAAMQDDFPEDTRLRLSLEGRDPDEGVSDIAYEKGRFFLRMIEREVGRASFDAFIKAWFDEHAFGTATTNDFIAYLEKTLIKGDINRAKAINYQEWIDEPGLPSNIENLRSEELNKVRADLEKYSQSKDPKSISAEKYTTHHWLYLLRNLPKLNAAEMRSLDDQFHFVMSGNAEILCDWYQLALKNDYQEIFPAIKKFLHEVGRRKFLMPLYRLMVEKPQYRPMAEEIFSTAKSGYHSVSAKSIEELLRKR